MLSLQDGIVILLFIIHLYIYFLHLSAREGLYKQYSSLSTI